jgi:hypothetical protein
MEKVCLCVGLVVVVSNPVSAQKKEQERLENSGNRNTRRNDLS